ncbi:DUF397 domain-containing protein [Streptomyces sp. LX-29]|uniref:DUF397 domain-containing protein n=1 Tax=Streptomyces sp. LX-29 TaxID=2900152 RepID=UPI00240E0A5B|nr:DUF397 domain-containing protein [Streptomyces sp. LX-29]WFB09426.1 DUF397 domain-containing protein [Streptomyces sp. LX-29]
MHEVGPIEARWRTSSYSSGNGQCVEIAFLHGVVATRDSKNPDGPTLAFPVPVWAAFVASVTEGERPCG